MPRPVDPNEPLDLGYPDDPRDHDDAPTVPNIPATAVPGRSDAVSEPLVPPPPLHPSPPSSGPAGWRHRFDTWRHTYPKTEAVVFFMAGFCFDLLMLKRIDSVPMLIHQGAYNVLLTVFLVLDHRHTISPRVFSGTMAKVVEVRYGLIHFLFGTLFNAYVVFYFRAASGLGPLLFIGIIAALLVANELPRFRKLGPILRFGLLGFSWASFLAYLLPTLAGFLDPWLFYLAMALSAGLAYLTWRVTSRVTRDPAWTFRRGAAPALAAQALLFLLYALKLLPPVPLSLQSIGIAYDVAPRAGQLDVSTLTSEWKFWGYGDQDFKARPGDRVFVYARIFAPRRFRDTLYVRWAYEDPRRGWVESDRIPLTIKGGEKDWRGWAYKRNYAPGDWRVTIETDDERALGRLSLTITPDTETSTRTFRRFVE